MAWDPALKARPTVYNGIQMRSRLEAGYAAWLDQHQFDWEYEPCAFSGAGGIQYLPDFRLKDVPVLGRAGLVTVYVEVKPASWGDGGAVSNGETDADLDAFAGLMRSMAVILASEPDALLLLETPVDNDARYAETSILAWEDCVAMHWPHFGAWCPLGGDSARLGLARMVGRRHGPWFGKWWTGQVV